MPEKIQKINLGRLGAIVQSSLCLITAVMITFLSREQLSNIYFPFMAAFHESFLAMILVGFSIFYILLGLGMINRCFGYFIGIIHCSLGIFTVIFRSLLIREIELSAVFSLLLVSVITVLMIFGWRSSSASRSKLSLKLLRIGFGIYFLFAFGTYPLSYVVGYWNRSSLELEELEPSKPFQRFFFNVDGFRQSAYYGELHGHSYFSIDARVFGASSPEEYFRYARDIAGLDFCSLTDHDSPNGIADYPELWRYINSLTEKYNEPGKFITFNAFEWTSGEGHHEIVRHWTHKNKWSIHNDHSIYGHRNIIFPGSKVPILPFSHNDPNIDTPEELWELMNP